MRPIVLDSTSWKDVRGVQKSEDVGMPDVRLYLGGLLEANA